ncbi:MAG: glycosyltransferase [Proteobacteria bacterium]|nr:glycosyltransferase [Pseudomonadota bacterium]MBU1740064.1 glycosyltransferase [Pseudomonadota bacterium]
MRLLRVGAGDLDEPLRNAGAAVVAAESLGPSPSPAEPDLTRVIRLAGGVDAVLLVDDLGGRVFPTGLVRCPAPVVHYGLDAPINFWWQRHYAVACDLVLLDQKEPAERLAAGGHPVHWLPVGIDPGRYRAAEGASGPDFDLGFVGVINDHVRPKRSRIVDFISSRYRLEVAGGRQGAWVPVEEAARLYGRSKMVLNENLFPGLTTRVLEGMACGRPVLTEGGNGADGLRDHFRPDEDLVTYDPLDLAAKLEFFLSDAAARDRVARRGRDKCLSGHTLDHRAARLVSLIEPLLGRPHRPAADVHARLGRAYLLARIRWPRRFGDRLLRRARLHLNRALAGEQASGRVHLDLATAALIEDRPDDARPHLVAAAETGAAPLAHLYLGLLDLDRGRIDTGRDRLLAAARAEPEPEAAEALGRAARGQWPSALGFTALGRYFRLKNMGLTPGFMRRSAPFTCWRAMEWYQAALALEPDLAPALAGLAGVLADGGAFTEAYQFYDLAVRLRPGDAGLQESWQHAGRMGYCFL